MNQPTLRVITGKSKDTGHKHVLSSDLKLEDALYVVNNNRIRSAYTDIRLEL